jgi:hypothetical protein
MAPQGTDNTRQEEVPKDRSSIMGLVVILLFFGAMAIGFGLVVLFDPSAVQRDVRTGRVRDDDRMAAIVAEWIGLGLTASAMAVAVSTVLRNREDLRVRLGRVCKLSLRFAFYVAAFASELFFHNFVHSNAVQVILIVTIFIGFFGVVVSVATHLNPEAPSG